MNNYNEIVHNPKLCYIFSKISKISKIIIIGLMFFIFSFLSINSILETTEIKVTDDSLETILYNHDNVIINMIIIALFLVIMTLLSKNILKRIDCRIFSIILCVYTFSLGLFWILSVKSTSAHDSYTLTLTAEQIANGNYNMLQSSEPYFYNYPFQLGYVFICQIVNTLFKDNYFIALEILNLIALVMIFLAIVKFTQYIFKSKIIVNTTILLLFGCLQGIMFTTFIYGNLLGFAFSMWAVVLEIEYIQTDKKYLMVISAFLIGLSIMVKSNNMIVLTAMCIILFIKFLDTKKLWDILSILICILIGTNILNIVISGYENKANVDLGTGVPKILWLNMGLHETDNGYGWYNGRYTIDIYSSNNCEPKSSTNEGIRQIKEQIKFFYNNPDYTTTFFTEKTLSQWNEPTYTSIWVSETRGHIEDTPQFVEDIYENSLGDYIRFYMNQYQQILLLLSCITFALIYKKKDVSFYFIPLIILGGFLYHLLFEAKSQYVITYFMLLIPMSSYSLNVIVKINFGSKFKRLLKIGASDTSKDLIN